MFKWILRRLIILIVAVFCSTTIFSSTEIVSNYLRRDNMKLGDLYDVTINLRGAAADGCTRPTIKQLFSPASFEWVCDAAAEAASVSKVVLSNVVYNPNPYGTAYNDYFGGRVSSNSTYTVATAVQEDESGASNSGKAYIIDNATGEIVQTIDNPNAYGTATSDMFGTATAINEDYVAISATNEDDAGGSSSGRVYVFNTTDWGLEYTIENPNDFGTPYGDEFGYKVALSDSYILVSAPAEEDDNGTVYLFNITNGALIHTFNNPNEEGDAYDWFGEAIAVTDTHVAISSTYETQEGLDYSGKIYMYNAVTGAYLYTIDNPSPFGTFEDDELGYSVELTDKYVLSGAQYETDENYDYTGIAYLFDITDGSLVHTLANPNVYGETDDWFGETVAVTDKYMLISAGGEDTVEGSNSGIAYLFDIVTGDLLAVIDNPNAASTVASDYFSYYMDMTDSQIIIGVTGEDAGATNAGVVYIFDIIEGETIIPAATNLTLKYALPNPNASGLAAYDWFGGGLSTSPTFTAVGAYGEVQNELTDSGAVYLFDNATGNLERTFVNPNDYDTPLYDGFGNSVAVTDNYMLVGAYGEDYSGGTNSGKAYIFNTNTGQLLHTLDNPNEYDTEQGDQFGIRVAMTDNYSVVAAPSEDDADGTDAGAVYVFNTTTGALLHTLDNPGTYGTNAGDDFGFSIDVFGNYIAVGAPNANDSEGTLEGRIYVYNASTGSLIHTIVNPNFFGPTSSDEFGHNVAINDDYIVVGAIGEGTSDTGIAYVFDTATGDLLYSINDPNAFHTPNWDSFGCWVSVSGDYAVIGAYMEQDQRGDESGKAYIFHLPSGDLIHTIDNPNPFYTSDDDWFGSIVSMNGSYISVGAYKEDEDGQTDSGAAFIYKLELGAAAPRAEIDLLHTLDNPTDYGTAASDQFGGAIAMTDSHTIVGARFEDDAGGSASGKAYIFNTSTGALVHTLDNPNDYDTSAGDLFGESVAISDSYSVVGAPEEDDASGASSGKAYVFNNSTGAEMYTLDNPNDYGGAAGDQFGDVVAISDDYVAVAGHQEDDAGGSGSGKVYVFTASTGTYLRTLDNPNAHGTSANDKFGTSISISDSYIAVSASLETDEDSGGNNSGKVYIFNASTGSLVTTIDNPSPWSTSAYDEFGNSISLTDTVIAVGAWQEGDSEEGRAYIFSTTSGTLLHELRNPSVFGTVNNDQFGYSVATTDDYVVVGARYEDDASGNSSGKAYVFDVSDGELVQTVDNPNDYGTSASDNFGTCVAISASYVAAGAQFEDEASASASGKAYIFSITEPE